MVSPYPTPIPAGNSPPPPSIPAAQLIQPNGGIEPPSPSFADSTAGIRSIAENYAAGFSRDPERRKLYQQKLAYDEEVKQKQLQDLRQQQMHFMDQMQELALNGGWQSKGVQSMVDRAAPSIDALFGQGTADQYKASLEAAHAAYQNKDQGLVQAVGPDGQMTWMPKSQAAGMQSALPSAPQTREVRIGNEQVTQQFNRNTGQWEEVGRGAAFAPPAQTNINVSTGQKAVLESDTEALKLGETSAAQSREILPMLDLAEQAAKQYKSTGPGGGIVLDIKRLASSLGMKTDAPAGEVLSAMQQKLAGLQRMPGSGAQSDKEFATYMASVPGLAQTQAGNIALAGIGRKLIKRKLAEFERYKAYVVEHGNSVGFQYDETPALTEQEFNQLAGAAFGGQSTTEIPPPPPGFRVIQ